MYAGKPRGSRLPPVAAAVLLLFCVLSGGCAVTALDRTLAQAKEPGRQSLNVAVAVLRDERPGAAAHGPGCGCGAAADPVADAGVPDALARAVVDRLNGERLFRSAALFESAAAPAAEELALAAGEGYDALLTGAVRRCEASCGVTGGGGAGVYVLRVVLIIAPALSVPFPLGRYCNEGNAVVTDLRLTDTRSGALLWQGSFSRKVVNYTSEPSPAGAEADALRAAAAAIVDDLAGRREPDAESGPRPAVFSSPG